MCRPSWRAETEAEWRRARGFRTAGDGKSRWSREEASAFYRTTLAEAGQIANKSVSSGFEETRKRTFEEFSAFIDKVGQGVTVENARGLDVLAFVHGRWIPAHRNRCRTVGESGEKIPSAAAIKAVIQHIAKSYAMLGRSDAENPGKEEAVKNYREGYRNDLHARGVKEKHARVFKESKVTDLIAFLEAKLKSVEGIPRCVVLMDKAAVLYLWESWARGKECGELEVGQIDFEAAESRPGWTKTIRQEPSGRVELSRDGTQTFIDSSVELLLALEQEKVPLGRGFLFRPLNKQRNGFEDEPLKSAALSRRVRKHLTDAGLFEGETLHSFRRSAVQNAAGIEGFDVKKLMQRGRWTSYAAFKVYVSEIEHCFARQV